VCGVPCLGERGRRSPAVRAVRSIDVVVDPPVLCQHLGLEEGVEEPFRCSSRMRPLNDSIQAFCHCDPGSMKIVVAELNLHQSVVTQLMGASRRTDTLARLSSREREVLALMAEGRSNSAIAVGLVISEGAVEKHVANIFSKLDLAATSADHRRVLAVLRYLEG